MTTTGVPLTPIQQKLANNADKIQNGDIMLFHGNEILSKIIEWADKSWASHSGIIIRKDRQLFILDSTLDKKANGVEIDFLINTINTEIDFCVLRPKVDKSILENALNLAIEQGILQFKYNKFMLLQFLIYLKLGKDLTHLSTRHAYICSQFVQFYTDQLGFTEYSSEHLIAPQDFIRKLNPEHMEIIIPQN